MICLTVGAGSIFFEENRLWKWIDVRVDTRKEMFLNHIILLNDSIEDEFLQAKEKIPRD